MSVIINTVNKLYYTIVVGNQKAIVGFVLGFAGIVVAQVGLSLDMTLRELIEALVGGAVTSAGVWFKANK